MAPAVPQSPFAAGRRLVGRLKTDSLLRNGLYIMATTVVTSAFGYVFWVVAARTRSAHDVGLAAALIAAVTLAGTASSEGLGGALIQLLPSRPDGRAWSLTLSTGLAAAAIAGGISGTIAVVLLRLFYQRFGLSVLGVATRFSFWPACRCGQ